MAKFIMANRRAGKFHENEKAAARASLDVAFATELENNVNVTGDSAPIDEQTRRIIQFEADPAEIAAKINGMPLDVIIEPEILHYPVGHQFLKSESLAFVNNSIPLDAGVGTTLKLQVTGGGSNIKGVEVVLFLRAPNVQPRRISQITPASGKVAFSFNSFWIPALVIVIPPGNFWSVVVRGPQNNMTIDLPPLPTAGPLGWWHRVMGINAYQPTRGTGIKVGVIDSGCGLHPNLSHINLVGSFIDTVYDPNGGLDVGSHGSHVCGTIGGYSNNANEYAGIAPGVSLYSARVFPNDEAGANQGDIVMAIEHLSKISQVDLINMSLGAPFASQIEQDAIQDALERGTLCVCAAGNSSGVVEYPGAFPQVIGVSALGLEGWAPEGAISAGRYPENQEMYGDLNLFLSNFSCFGTEIDCSAPGVGIIAPVPERFGLTTPYVAMDGTSMASPAACGALAAILSLKPGYTSLPRDISRAETARALLKDNCRDLRMPSRFQGRGLPQVS